MGIGETSFVPNTAYGFNPLPKEISGQNKTIDDALGTQTDGRNDDTGQIEQKGTVLQRMVPGHEDSFFQPERDPEEIAAPEQGMQGTHQVYTMSDEGVAP